MQTRSFRSLLYPLCAAIFALATPAMAQSAGKPAAAQPSAAEMQKMQAQMQKMQKMQEQMQKLGMQLAAIERKTIAGSPELQAQRQKFSAHVMKAMKTLGYDPEGDTKRLNEIKHKVLSGKLKAGEREAQIKKFRSIRMHLLQGQAAAMQDKGLQQESKKLNEATMLAMKKQDPHTDALIKQFNAIGAKLRGMRQAAMGQR